MLEDVTVTNIVTAMVIVVVILLVLDAFLLQLHLLLPWLVLSAVFTPPAQQNQLFHPPVLTFLVQL